jgi:hypothetical protein
MGLSSCLPSQYLKTEEEPASETSWFYILIFYPDDGQSPEDNWFSLLLYFCISQVIYGCFVC